MKVNHEILIVIGIVVGFFSAVIPFATIFSEELEDIIYFRGILLGFIFVSVGSAALLNGYYKIITISIGCGIVAVFIASSFNLMFDELINTYNYFKIAFLVFSISLLIVISIKVFGVYFIKLYYTFQKNIKACWNKLSRGYR